MKEKDLMIFNFIWAVPLVLGICLTVRFPVSLFFCFPLGILSRAITRHLWGDKHED